MNEQDLDELMSRPTSETIEHYRRLIKDNQLPYTLNIDLAADHETGYVSIQLPVEVTLDSVIAVNMMAPHRESTPEELIEGVSALIKKRDALKAKGYVGDFSLYDDGAEYVYSIPAPDEDTILKVLRDFAFKDGY